MEQFQTVLACLVERDRCALHSPSLLQCRLQVITGVSSVAGGAVVGDHAAAPEDGNHLALRALAQIAGKLIRFPPGISTPSISKACAPVTKRSACGISGANVDRAIRTSDAAFTQGREEFSARSWRCPPQKEYEGSFLSTPLDRPLRVRRQLG